MSVHPLPTPLRRQSEADAPASRMAQLRAQAAAIAREQTADFEEAIGALAVFAEEISDGGEAFPVGAREVARVLAGHLAAATQTLQVLRLR